MARVADIRCETATARVFSVALSRALDGSTPMFRLLIVIAAALAIAACSGSDGDSEAQLRSDVESFTDALLGSEPDLNRAAGYFPEECPITPEELATVRRGVESLELDQLDVHVANIELLSSTRARVKVQFLRDGEVVFGAERGADLWILQEGRWRDASDCEVRGIDVD